MRLNKYISNSGICTRREADELINSGNIKVNNITIVELGYRIKKNDIVTLNEKEVKYNKSIYILINKPKNYLMESNDKLKERSLRSIISNACEEYLYPTQYLNEMDTGLILYTNNKKLIEKFSRSEDPASIPLLQHRADFSPGQLRPQKLIPDYPCHAMPSCRRTDPA